MDRVIFWLNYVKVKYTPYTALSVAASVLSW